MKVLELYGRVRYAVQIEGLSRREAARQFGIDPRTVAKMLAFSVPPGYRRRRPPARPKLDPFTGIIDGILAGDEGRPSKQRHTSKRIFERLRDEHAYAGRFGRPGKGNDKGKVEGLVGWIRRNLLVPVPRAASFTALNEQLLEGCRRRLGDRLRGHDETIGERLARDLAAFQDLPPAPYDACEKKAARVSSQSLVRYRGTDYSVPTAYGHREVVIRGYVHEVVISCGATVIARGVIGFDAVKHLVLCRIERRPPRLDLTVYPYLPRATVAITSARAYLDLLTGASA